MFSPAQALLLFFKLEHQWLRLAFSFRRPRAKDERENAPKVYPEKKSGNGGVRQAQPLRLDMVLTVGAGLASPLTANDVSFQIQELDFAQIPKRAA